MSEDRTPFEDPGLPREPSKEDAPARVRDRDSDRVRDRDRRRRGSRMEWNPGTWIGGAVLILLGVVLLLENAGIDVPWLENWWAFFIFIPAGGSFVRAWNEVQARGRLSGEGVGALVGGVVLTLVAFTLLFELPWSLMLPVLLILGGLSLLITAIAVNR